MREDSLRFCSNDSIAHVNSLMKMAARSSVSKNEEELQETIHKQGETDEVKAQVIFKSPCEFQKYDTWIVHLVMSLW